MISLDKKYKTRDGRDVRLLCTDGPGQFPVIGIVDGDDSIGFWLSSGMMRYDRETRYDLIEVPNTVTKTFYRRKWFLHRKQEFVAAEHRYLPSKEVFDYEYGVKEHPGTWSDEWETITVEVPV